MGSGTNAATHGAAASVPPATEAASPSTAGATARGPVKRSFGTTPGSVAASPPPGAAENLPTGARPPSGRVHGVRAPGQKVQRWPR